MQRLNRGMLRRYDIPEHPPERLRAVQFGMDETLLGVADRLIDASGLGVGIACLPAGAPPAGGGANPAALLREQDGLYTLLVRGYQGDEAVRRELVIQSILSVPDADGAPEALAAEPALELCLLNAEALDPQAALRLAVRLLIARHRAGLKGLSFICLGETPDCAQRARKALAALAAESAPGTDFEAWLKSANAFYPALADGLAFRAEAHEAAKLCAEMNYADGMLHIAEPYARLTIQAPAAFRRRWPLDRAEGVDFVDDIAPDMAQKHRLFDAGLFAMAAPGWLLGLDSLSDCMKHDALRAFVGHIYDGELLPADPEARRADAPYVIRCFERFENPLNRNAILRASRPLLRRFALGALPLMRAWAAERFEPPRRLSFALAAAIMLYAGARPGADGRYTVARGNESQWLSDDPKALSMFATLSHDMPPEALAYAALADRALWHGEDLRQIDGLEARVALDIANMQRNPAYLPED